MVYTLMDWETGEVVAKAPAWSWWSRDIFPM